MQTKKELIPHIPVDHGEGEPVAEEQEEQDEGEEQEADVPTNTVVNKRKFFFLVRESPDELRPQLHASGFNIFLSSREEATSSVGV